MNTEFPGNDIFTYSKNPSIPKGDSSSLSFDFSSTISSSSTSNVPVTNSQIEPPPCATSTQNEAVAEPVQQSEPEPKKEEEEAVAVDAVIESPPKKDYIIETTSTSIVKLPPGYDTDDRDEKELVDLFNGKNYKWQERKLKHGLSVFYVPFDESCTILTRQHFNIPCPYDSVIKAFLDPEYRKKWDKSLSNKTKVLSSKKVGECEIDHIYTYIKMPFIFSDRDFVQKRKLWRNYTTNPRSMLIHSKSYDHDSYPEKEKPVRATIHIMGFYFQEIDAQNTMYSTISRGDFGFPTTFYNKMKEKVGDRSSEQIAEFIKACKAVK